MARNLNKGEDTLTASERVYADDGGLVGRAAKIFGWIVVCVLGVLLLLASIVPNFISEPVRAPTSACIDNLRLIDGAKQAWAFQTKADSNATPTWENIQPYFGRGANGKIPKCSQGGQYTIGNLSSTPTCSIIGHTLD
jgi:hypothetical protein